MPKSYVALEYVRVGNGIAVRRGHRLHLRSKIGLFIQRPSNQSQSCVGDEIRFALLYDELPHRHTHIIPRMKKVIDGEDLGGITKAVNWKGGGFRYYRLAPSLLEKDKWGNWIINREYNADMLAEALCKLEGFTYAPSETVWWQHSHSTEQDFIYVTTQNLAADQLQAFSEEVSEGRRLLVLSSAFRGVSAAKAAERWSSLTIRKIPKSSAVALRMGP